MGGHKHLPLLDGRAKKAQEYPQRLALMNGDDNNDAHDFIHTYIDDLSGKELEPEGVKKARLEEVEVFKSHNAYSFVPITECHAFTGKQPIATRWVDVNKGDENDPEYRSRCVAKKIHRR